MRKKSLEIKQIGIQKVFFNDLYYRVIKASWANFLFSAGLFYLILNFLFALLYYFSPAQILHARPDSLWDAFIFSFQTSSTLGYGYFVPNSNVAHIIVMLDTMLGIFYVALMTGLAFSKFSRPSAKIIFSDKIIFTTFDHVPTLMFRLGNNRETNIIDAKINVAILLPYITKEGLEMKRFFKLNLLSNENPTFSLSWTAIHQLDENSPIKGFTIQDLQNKKAIIFISFTGIDDVLSQTIHSNYRYTSQQFIAARKFTDILKMENENLYTVDFRNFHDIEQ
jgi:inward rectifier potassium channel